VATARNGASDKWSVPATCRSLGKRGRGFAHVVNERHVRLRGLYSEGAPICAGYIQEAFGAGSLKPRASRR
jgi:hypothetical protein